MAEIHPTAIISSEAELADNVSVGPYAVIQGPVKIAANVTIEGHAHLCGETQIGENSEIGWGAIIGANPQDLHFDRKTRSGVVIGPRNVIRDYVTIHRGSKEGGCTTLGADNFLMTGVHVAHDVAIGNSNILANNVLLAGHIRVGDRVFLGGGAVFHQFIRIGDLAMVQGGSALSQDIPPYCIAHGHNLIAGLNSVGMRRAGFSAAVRNDIKRAYRWFFLLGKPRAEALEEASSMQWTPETARFIEALANTSSKGVAHPDPGFLHQKGQLSAGPGLQP